MIEPEDELVNHCLVLTGIPQLLYLLSTLVPSTCCKEKKAVIDSQKKQAINFTQVPFRCVLGMPSNSRINAEFQKRTCKKYDLIC